MTTPTMVDRVNEYLTYRRSLGYLLRIEGQMLLLFARYADESGHRGPVTTELALRWARLPQQAARLYHARRLEVVRTLARYLVPREPGTEVPPRGLLGSAHARKPAFLYSDADLSALLEAARLLAPADGLRRRTYATLIGLMACTGLRINEALTLGADDIDLDAGVLTIRQTKFHKSRLVPLHATALAPLRDYVADRDSRHRQPRDTTFFVSDVGLRLPYTTVRHTFHQLLRRAMPEAAPAGRARPRFHDLRHTFACRRLTAWYHERIEVDRVIDQLSAYLGHAKVTDTYWYLTGVPELLALAGSRFEQFSAPAQGGTS
jgi:integrase